MDTELIKTLSALSLTHWLLLVFYHIVIVGLLTFGFIRWFWRKQWRLYKNLKRSIMIVTPTGQANEKIPSTEMELERKMLKDNGFLNINDQVTDFRSFKPASNHCILVIGYHQDMQGLDELITKVKHLQIPVIIYTYGKNIGAIADKHMRLFNSYPLILYANFQLTLMNHIFSTLASYPYDKK